MADANRPGDIRAGPAVVRHAIRAPRAAAVAGIVFSVLTSAALALTNTLLTQSMAAAGRWLADHTHRDTVSAVLGLVSIAGIALLWFIAVIRDHLGEAEDRFFSTVFLGSGLLFIAMLLAAAAVMAGVVDSAAAQAGAGTAAGSPSEGLHISRELLETAARLAAIFALAG